MWPNPQETADLVAFTEEILNGKLDFLCRGYTWCMKIHFQFHFFAIWSISDYILSTMAWKAPESSLFRSKLAMFLKIDPRCFGPLGMFQDTKDISI